MSEHVIYLRATREEIERELSRLPGMVAHDTTDAIQALKVRLGLTLLGRIRTAFIVKARGGTDEAGDRWQPLSPKTIAYSRRHKGLPRASARAAKRPSYALTAKQRARWWAVYGNNLARFKGDKGHAAAVAWLVLKSEGATTLLQKYGTNRKGAAAHHNGIPGKLPQRRLWPDPSRWPMKWINELQEQCVQGMVDVILWLFRG